jgi:hypothetical protein
MFEEAKAVPVPSDAHAVPTEIDIKEVRARCADLLRRAILTMAALPDRERRFLAGLKSNMPETTPTTQADLAPLGLHAIYDAAKEASEQQALRASRFKPTMQDVDRCLDVLEWLRWLGYRNDGRKEVRIITAWAHGVPMWKLAQRYGRSDDTVRRWLDGAVAAIALKFRGEIERMM